MSTCPACRRDRHHGCDGVQVNAHRYGHEDHWYDGSMAGLEPHDACIDCSTPLGEHHHANCLQARCMVCDDQAVCCPHARENRYVL